MRRAIPMVLVVALILSAAALGGCRKQPVQTVTPPAQTGSQADTSGSGVTQEATSSGAYTTGVESSGPISTPAPGSDERTKLMNAAREKLNTTSQFYVYQLYVQGNTALGDIEPVSGGERSFVAWQVQNQGWVCLWSAPFGSADAKSAAADAALPDLSAALLAKIDWTMPKPLKEADMIASLSAAATKWAKSAMGGAGQPYTITMCKVDKDAHGVWFGHVVVQPTGDATNAYEPLNIWAKYSGGSWSGKIQDPEPPAPSTYFPASVIPHLSLP